MKANPSTRPDEWMLRNPILLIDDNPANLELLERTLEWGGFMNLKSCRSAKDGLLALETFDPYLVILDLNMPGMDGYEFLKQVREKLPQHSFLPILVFTADLTPVAKIKALELGASDFVTKPGDPIEFQLKIMNFLRTRKLHGELQKHNETLEAKVRERTQALELARKEAIEMLAKVSEYRDDDTGQHVRRVGELSARLAKHIPELSDEFLENLRLAAPLHDIGKMAIPDSILHKNGSLTEEESEVMRSHVSVGGEILNQNFSPVLKLAREIALNHHERWDGSGYPFGLAGEEIPVSARIVAVADAYDAMTNDRIYRKARTKIEAFKEIEAMSGLQFDPAIVESLRFELSSKKNVAGYAA